MIIDAVVVVVLSTNNLGLGGQLHRGITLIKEIAFSVTSHGQAARLPIFTKFLRFM